MIAGFLIQNYKMSIKRKDFQKAAAMVHEFLLKLGFEPECAELRDALNLALLHMQRYYRLLRTRMANIDRTSGSILAQSIRGLSPMTPFKDAPDKFQWRWINLDNPKMANHLPTDVSTDVRKLPPVIHAAKEADNERITTLFHNDPECMNDLDGLGRNALMYAAHFSHCDTMQALVDNGIDVNAHAHDGSTAVHRACHDGNHEALQILISYGANVTVADSQGRYPIHWACANKELSCLQLLIDQRVNVNVRDKEGMSPSMWACRMDHCDHLGLLTEAEQVIEEEDGQERDNQGRTMIHWSVRRTEPLECLRTLLTDQSADWRDEEGKSVMHTCAEQGSLAAAKVILEIAGSSSVLDHQDNEKRTPLILAACGGHGEVLNYLLAQGADHAADDNFGATAWDYARAKQLHYCMLIVASYIRQRAKDEERTEGTLDGIPEGGEENDFALSGMNSLQINGNPSTGEQLYYGNRPVAAPQPPSEPRTPRTPRHNQATTPRNPNVPGGWETPRSPPPTARGGPSGGVKRLPSGSDSNGEGQRTYNRPSKRESTAGKRKKNTHDSPERASRMSLQSVNGSQEFDTPRYDAEPEMNAESEYLNESSDHAEQERSVMDVSGMDVSDFEANPGQEGDDERTIIEEDGMLQPMESEQHRPYRSRGRGPATQGSGGGPGGGVSSRQSSQHAPPPGSGHVHHNNNRYAPPTSPKHSSPSRQAPPTQQPYYSPHRDDHYDEEDDGEVVHTPSPPPRQSKPYSYQKNAVPPPSPPPHLQPLPPTSPGKKKKKKKNRERDSSLGGTGSMLAPVAGPVPQSQRGGYAAPVQPPPSSPHPSSASSSHHMHPNSPRGRSPTSRNSSASTSRHSGGGDPLYSGGGGNSNGLNYMAGGLVGSRPPPMKPASNKVQGFANNNDLDYRQSNNHASLNQPATKNKPPVFPKAAPRSKSQRLNPLQHSTESLTSQSNYSTHRGGGDSSNYSQSNQSPNRGGGGTSYDQRPPRSSSKGHRLGSGSGGQGSKNMYGGSGRLPNGNVPNGYGDPLEPQHSGGYPQKHGSSRNQGSGHRKQRHPGDQPPSSPRGGSGSRSRGGQGAPPPVSGKRIANGRLPPTY